jgi:hypothetical protein
MIWLCDSNECHAAAKRVYSMADGTLDAYERAAVLEASSAAGAYLEELGQTNLGQLSRDEWLEFLRRIVVGYEHALRRMILANEPPF